MTVSIWGKLLENNPRSLAGRQVPIAALNYSLLNGWQLIRVKLHKEEANLKQPDQYWTQIGWYVKPPRREMKNTKKTNP